MVSRLVSLKAVIIELRGCDETGFDVIGTKISRILKRLHECVVGGDGVAGAWTS